MPSPVAFATGHSWYPNLMKSWLQSLNTWLIPDTRMPSRQMENLHLHSLGLAIGPKKIISQSFQSHDPQSKLWSFFLNAAWTLARLGKKPINHQRNSMMSHPIGIELDHVLKPSDRPPLIIVKKEWVVFSPALLLCGVNWKVGHIFTSNLSQLYL